MLIVVAERQCDVSLLWRVGGKIRKIDVFEILSH
jgi:hypothetical protein